jgi:aryl-alcohol dehydrogenase-like predicted oxidoreductase
MTLLGRVAVLNRRDILKFSTCVAGASLLDAAAAFAAEGPLIARAVPKTGERLPMIGLGSSATFAGMARSEDATALRAVLKALVDGGGRVLDTAPGYGASEEVAGTMANELGIRDKIFWATKVNASGRDFKAKADPKVAWAQIEASFKKFNLPKIDMIQVHDVADVATHLPIVKELKAAGRIRYIGITSTRENQYEELISYMKNEPLDFVGVDYAVDNREVEKEIFPLAQDRGIGVLNYVPFGRTRLFARVKGRDLPAWAAEFDAKTWAQFFLKFCISHPAVTVVTPATSNLKNLLDNLGGGVGRMPTDDHRKRMIALIESLPPA